MKNPIKISCALLSVIGMTACSDGVDINNAISGNSVKINAVIASSLSSRANTLGDGNSWSDGDQIYVVNTTSNAVAGKNKGAYKYSGTSWTTTDALVWTTDGATNTFEAYYPYLSGVSYAAFTLPTDQSSSTNICNSDWMIASVSAAPGDNKTIDLAFQHQLAKVVVTISDPSKLYSTLALSDVTVKLPTGDVDTRVTTSGDITPYVSGATITVLLPCGNYSAGGVFLTVKVNGNDDFTVKVPSGGFALEKGKSYECEASISREGVSFANVTVSKWTDKVLGSGTANEVADSESNGGNVNDSGENSSDETINDTNTAATAGPLKVNGTELKLGEDTNIANTIKSSIVDSKLTFTGTVSSGQEDTFWSEIKSALNTITSDVNIDMSALGGITSVPESEFNDVSSTGFPHIESVSLPECLKSIGKQAFRKCTGLTSVNIAGNTEISEEAFYGCSSLKSVLVPKVTTMGINVFKSCTSLKEISLPQLVNIGRGCFSGTGISSLYLPEVITVVGNTFNGATSLTSVYLPKANHFQTRAFYGITSGTLYLTVSGNITLEVDSDASAFTNSSSGCDMSNVALYLNPDKKDGGTATPQVVKSNYWGINKASGTNVKWASISFQE